MEEQSEQIITEPIIIEDTLFKSDFPHLWGDNYIYLNKTIWLWIEISSFTFVLD